MLTIAFLVEEAAWERSVRSFFFMDADENDSIVRLNVGRFADPLSDPVDYFLVCVSMQVPRL